MTYHIHVTVNTPRGEYEITFPDAESLDAVLQIAKDIHTNATSFLFAIVPNKD